MTYDIGERLMFTNAKALTLMVKHYFPQYLDHPETKEIIKDCEENGGAYIEIAEVGDSLIPQGHKSYPPIPNNQAV